MILVAYAWVPPEHVDSGRRTTGEPGTAFGPASTKRLKYSQLKSQTLAAWEIPRNEDASVD